jgi:hypothetical protein
MIYGDHALNPRSLRSWVLLFELLMFFTTNRKAMFKIALFG